MRNIRSTFSFSFAGDDNDDIFLSINSPQSDNSHYIFAMNAEEIEIETKYTYLNNSQINIMAFEKNNVNGALLILLVLYKRTDGAKLQFSIRILVFITVIYYKNSIDTCFQCLYFFKLILLRISYLLIQKKILN